MAILTIGLIIFFGIHLLPAFPQKRQQLIDRFGEKGYRARFALLSAIGLGLIIYGKAYAGFVHVWNPPAWGHQVPFFLMLPVLILMPAADMPGHIRKVVKHPMLIGVILWAAAHLLANGDLASLLLFGGFGLFALFDLFSVNRRGKQRKPYEPNLKFDIIAVVAGVILYGLIQHFHAFLFRVPAIF